MNVLYDAVAYPLRKHGWQIILVSTIVWLLLAWTLALPLINLGLFVLYAAYFGSYYLKILSETVNGNDMMPNWPDFMNVVDDILKPALRLVVIVVNTWLPLIIVLVMHTQFAPVPRIIGVLALMYGIFSFPMTALLVQVSGRYRAGLPHIVLSAMFELGWRYAVVAIACNVAVLAWLYLPKLLFGRSVAGAVFNVALLIYMVAFQARITGLLYRMAKANADEPGTANT